MSEMDDIFKSLMGEEKQEKKKSLAETFSMLKDYIDYLWNKKWIVVIAGFSFAVLGLVYACIRTIEYTATYGFAIEGDSGNKPFTMAALLGTGAVGAFSGDNLVELMRTPSMVEKTLLKAVPNRTDSINFIEYYLICDSVRVACEKAKEEGKEKASDVVSICDVYFPLHQNRNTFTRAQDSILKLVAQGIVKKLEVVKPEKKLAFVNCSYTYTDEEFCKVFLDAYMEEVIAFYLETKTIRSNRSIENFQRQADSLRLEMNRTLSSKAYYADANLNSVRQSVGVELQKKQMELQSLSTAYLEIVKGIATMRVDQMKETPLIQIISEPHYPLDNNKARKLKFIIVGGFLGGFLSVLTLLGICFYKKMIKPALAELPSLRTEE